LPAGVQNEPGPSRDERARGASAAALPMELELTRAIGASGTFCSAFGSDWYWSVLDENSVSGEDEMYARALAKIAAGE
jgi:hypothetical protein